MSPAVDAAGALYPAVVVLDISMPGFSGFEAGALIRDLPDPPFYQDRQSLARTVARCIGEGLAANQPAVIVATDAHGASIRNQLTADGVSSDALIEQGELSIWDADEVLNRLMVGGRPDADRFEDTINPIVDTAAGTRKRLVRVYGEMVDVLWKSGREDAALSIETLWHRLIARRKCSLLCGYSSSLCQGEGFRSICHRHSHVVPLHTAR